MAAARLNLPTVFVSGRPMLAGHVKGREEVFHPCLSSWSLIASGTMTEDEMYMSMRARYVQPAVHAQGMYTANSMNCLTEALGMGLQRKRNNSCCIF